MFTAENAKTLGHLATLPSLQAFEESGVDLGKIASAAFDWAGEKKSTKPVVKALAQALRATGDVQGVTVSQFAQGVEMLSYAAACAPLLDSDRLARLIELASSAKVAYQPIEDVQGTSSRLGEILGGVAPQRRLKILTDLWNEAHKVSDHAPATVEEANSLWAQVSGEVLRGSSWDADTFSTSHMETLRSNGSDYAWWATEGAKFASVFARHSNQDSDALSHLVDAASKMPVVSTLEGRPHASQVIYALQAHGGVEHSDEVVNLVKACVEAAPYKDILPKGGLVSVLNAAAIRALLVAGSDVKNVNEGILKRHDIAELREVLNDVVTVDEKSITEASLFGGSVLKDRGAIHLATPAKLEELFVSANWTTQRLFLQDERISLELRRQAVRDAVREDVSENSLACFARYQVLFPLEEVVTYYLECDRSLKKEFFLSVPSREWADRLMEVETDPKASVNGFYAVTRNQGSWVREFINDYAKAVETTEAADVVVNYFAGQAQQLFDVERFANLPVGEIGRLLRLASTDIAARFLRGSYHDDHLLGDESWKWAVEEGLADLTMFGGHVGVMVRQGLFDDKVLAKYLDSDEPDVVKLLAARPNTLPAVRPVGMVEASTTRVVAALDIEGVTPPTRPTCWEDFTQLEGIRVYYYPEKLEALDGTVLPGTEAILRLVRNSRALEANAEYMGNCTAGYSSRAEHCMWAVFQFTVEGVDHNASVDIQPHHLSVGEINTRFNHGGVTSEVEDAFGALIAGLNKS